MIRVRGVSRAVLVVVCLAASAASAQPLDRSFNPQLFHPAPGPDYFISVEPAQPLGHKSFGVGLFFNYARNTFSILDYDSAQMRAAGTRVDLLGHALSMDVWGAIGLFRRLQIAVSIPMRLYGTGSDFVYDNPATMNVNPDVSVRAPSGFAMGDPRLHLKVLLYGKDYGFKLALSHWLGFPFGNDSEFGGEKHFTGFSGEPRLLAGWDAELSCFAFQSFIPQISKLFKRSPNIYIR